MGANSAIEWTKHTWNPWVGCKKVSPGCKNCYMYREQNQYGQDPNEIRRTKPATFNKPWTWNEKDPGLIFTSSWTDFFLEEADEWRDDAWEIVRFTLNNTYQILTKRPENILDRLPDDWGDGYPNVWLGVSVENQEMADLRIPILIDIPAKLRFLSCEPLLGPVELQQYLMERIRESGPIATYYPRDVIQWVIVGGESGPAGSARPMHPEWASYIQFICRVSRVPFFFKQWGQWAPAIDESKVQRLMLPDGTFLPAGERMEPMRMGMIYMSPLGKKKAGYLLNGEDYFEMPRKDIEY